MVNSRYWVMGNDNTLVQSVNLVHLGGAQALISRYDTKEMLTFRFHMIELLHGAVGKLDAATLSYMSPATKHNLAEFLGILMVRTKTVVGTPDGEVKYLLTARSTETR